MSRLDACLFALLRFRKDYMEPLASCRVDVGRFAQDHCQHMVTGSDFGEVDVRLQADASRSATLSGGNTLSRYSATEFGSRPMPLPTSCGAEAKAPHCVFGAEDQVVSEVARLDFLGELVMIGRFEDLVHVGQQGA